MAATMTDLNEVEIEYETVDGAEYEYKYKNGLLGEKAKITRRVAAGSKTKQKDDQAKAEVLRIVSAMGVHPTMRGDELIDSACRALDLSRASIRRMEVEVEFRSGEEIEAKI